MKKLLVIVPHQDDEINLIGSILDQIGDAQYDLYIIFSTNGDYYKQNTKQRINEARNVMKKMKVSKTFFLGYSDKLISNKTDCISSQKTYGILPFCDFSYEKESEHKENSYINLKNDLKECIYQVFADLIICVDADNHPDHKLLSVAFDEVMKELICEKSYRPLILKKFAYEGVWFGEKDYFARPMVQTVPGDRRFFPYVEEQYIRIAVRPDNYDVRFWKTKVFELLKQYNSQNAIVTFPCVVNADSLYFVKNSKNLALQANVTSSSGDPSKIIDFKFIDFDNFYEDDYNLAHKNNSWIPDIEEEKVISMHFENQIKFSEIIIYQTQNLEGYIKKLRVEIDENVREYNLSKQDVIHIPVNKTTASDIKFKILEYDGLEIGISQIEIINDLQWSWEDFPFEEYVADEILSKKRKTLFAIVFFGYYRLFVWFPKKIKSVITKISKKGV